MVRPHRSREEFWQWNVQNFLRFAGSRLNQNDSLLAKFQWSGGAIQSAGPELLEMILGNQQWSWDTYLPPLGMSVRSKVNQNTWFTPNSLPLGREVHIQLWCLECQWRWWQRASRLCTTTGGQTRGSMRRGTYGFLGAQKHQKMYYDVNAWWREFEVEDLVYQIKDAWKPGLSRKLCPLYTGPLVIPKLSPCLYRVEDWRHAWVWHHEKLKICKVREIPYHIWRKRHEVLRMKTDGSGALHSETQAEDEGGEGAQAATLGLFSREVRACSPSAHRGRSVGLSWEDHAARSKWQNHGPEVGDLHTLRGTLLAVEERSNKPDSRSGVMAAQERSQATHQGYEQREVTGREQAGRGNARQYKPYQFDNWKECRQERHGQRDIGHQSRGTLSDSLRDQRERVRAEGQQHQRWHASTVRDVPQRKMKPRRISERADWRYEPYGGRGSTLTVETLHRVVTRVVCTLEVDRIVRMGSETVSSAAHVEQQRDQPLNLVIPALDAQDENCSPWKYLARARWVLSLMHGWLQHQLLFWW